ncbi:polyamine aminopropyltransferase, partial [bacterium]|nr:polyamine aminopropyltransferase [bacterium]
MEKNWQYENYKDILKIGYKVKEKLFSQTSPFQKVEVFETEGFGKMLFNDDLAMVSERDEFVYHDMITHVPMYTHPNPKNVLVIGGGDGGTAREVLRHKSVEKCTMVEIDGAVVEACKQLIPLTSSALEDERLELIIDDGVKFVAETKEKFDVILVDSTDPIGPAQPLFGDKFYEDIYSCLSDDGIVVSQGESPYYMKDMQNKLASILAKKFEVVKFYTYTNLTYPGGLWAFSYASKKLNPLTNFNKEA